MNNDNVKKKYKKILLAILFFPCLFIRRVIDNDTWFLLNSGRYVINYGIPHIEPFSIHKNMEFVLQQWLTDVIFWVTYNSIGENGLFIIVMLCYALIIFLMYKLTMKISGENYFVSFITTLLSSIFIMTYMVTRPTIFTLVIVLIELNLLENYLINNNVKYLFLLPILSLVLINLHAALWPILFVIMIPYIVESFKFRIGQYFNNGYKKKHLLITISTMILISYINPYGFNSMIYLFKSYGNVYMNNIMEILPPNINDMYGALVYLYILFIATVYIFFKNGKTKVRYTLLTIGTTYMVLTSIRNVTYFAICSIFPIAFYLKDYKIKENNSDLDKNRKIRMILIILIIIISVINQYNNVTNDNTYLTYLDLNNTIDYLLENEDTSNIILYTSFNDGSLVQFRGLPSYIDPRAEVYFKKINKKDDIFNEYFELQGGNIHYKDVLNKYKFTHFILTKSDILYTYLLRDNEYNEIYSNDSYYIFKRLD